MKVWYRELDGWWYVTRTIKARRKQQKLVQGADKKDEAEKRLHRLLVQEEEVAVPPGTPFKKLAVAFLLWSHKHNKPTSYAWYKAMLEPFCRSYRGDAGSLKRHHLTTYLETVPAGSHRAVICAVKRVLNWAVDEGYIGKSPLRGLKKPAAKRREKEVTDTEHRQFLTTTDPAFRTFLHALRDTGARPGEIRSVMAANVDLQRGLWVLTKHKTDRTGKPRIIYLSRKMVKLTRFLIERNPVGPIFRNSEGKPWTANAVRLRMRRLRKKLDIKDTVAYSYRHQFCTDALENGVDIATTAELMGHSSVDMIMQHYAHLAGRHVHMQNAVTTAVGRNQDQGPKDRPKGTKAS